jgi:sensor histidine kinase YesM
MLDSFAKMLRYSLSDVSSNITLKQELDYIKNYLSIQKYRFSDRIEYEIISNDNILDLEIPFFSLQPLVENAIEHGLLPLEKGGKLMLVCTDTDNYYSIDIIDNGTGIESKKLEYIKALFSEKNELKSNENLGMFNCYKRFKLLFGENLTFNIKSSKDLGTNINILIKK